jgi:hypothetical protein
LSLLRLYYRASFLNWRCVLFVCCCVVTLPSRKPMHG